MVGNCWCGRRAMELRGEAAVQGVKRLGVATLGPAVTVSMSRSALWVLGVEL